MVAFGQRSKCADEQVSKAVVNHLRSITEAASEISNDDVKINAVSLEIAAHVFSTILISSVTDEDEIYTERTIELAAWLGAELHRLMSCVARYSEQRFLEE